MLSYSIIMFILSALFLGISIRIYQGHTDLIHSYHQENVTDNAAYGKAFGKALSLFGIAPLISGIVSLFGDSGVIVALALVTLLLGIVIGTICLVRVQNKYNGGMFS